MSVRYSLRKRLGIVWCVALVIALMQWGSTDYSVDRLKTSLVYSYAISTLCWFFSDPCRYFLRGARAQGWYSVPFMWVSCWLGYVLGTWIGDRYSGRSTFDLWALAPAKFMGLLLASMAISAAFSAYFFSASKPSAWSANAPRRNCACCSRSYSRTCSLIPWQICAS